MNKTAIGDLLQALREGERLTDIDVHFARLMATFPASDLPYVQLAAALTSHAIQEGNVCLDLAAVAEKPLLEDRDMEFEIPICPDLNSWRQSLRSAAIVGVPGDYRPLILDSSDRLYLYRYWRYEKMLAESLLARSGHIQDIRNLPHLTESLVRLFPKTPADEPDYQRIAALVAALSSFCVITGGPGTGKTSTVVRILALLLEQSTERTLRIALAAPTGKAAARLKDSVRRAKDALQCDEAIKGRIPEEASTLHRLLGYLPRSSRFRFNAENRLPYDLLVVDEASMIDLPLMAKLADALRPDCRLILLGDRDQLASVQPGAVFGDICDTGTPHPYSKQLRGIIRQAEGTDIQPEKAAPENQGLQDSIVTLQKSYRFEEHGGIGVISRLVNQGEGAAALEAILSGQYDDISWRDLPPSRHLEKALEDVILHEYGEYLKAATPKEAFYYFGQFRILCALHHGADGVDSINEAATNILERARLIRPRERWYPGLPLLITRNDYHLKLFNGDVGIILDDPENHGGAGAVRRAFFPTETGEFRRVLPVRLPEHQPVYAMTVHKSQGSEFDRVLLLLPPVLAEVLSRELIYTGITRARQKVEIWGDREVFIHAVSRRITRTSGLRHKLWNTECGIL